MALNMDALGKKIGPLTREYSWKDIVLYALAVGAGSTELEFCYEKSLKVIPMFALATTFDFFWCIARESDINLSGILHGEHELIFHETIPRDGVFVTEGTINRYYDKGKDRGALVIGESDTFDSKGRKLFTNIYTLFARHDGGFGSDPVPKRVITYPGSEPTYVVDALPSPDQNLLYRLTGDYFELHVDPEFAEKSGFEKPIMHGACTLGYGCRALIRELTPGNPEKLKRLACRFSHFLYPGVPIQTLIWKTEEGRALWRVINAETGTAVIDNGVCNYDV
ncbi:MAG: MaoC family dehydratase N-terminal domain-containing protein [Deltaproteobacteria bacterium]|nr:MaoC family dehydratase N-terminal domain-containing protein [Deltaproteobacteria bacterium]